LLAALAECFTDFSDNLIVVALSAFLFGGKLAVRGIAGIPAPI
jgi:hypothetical protein